MEYDNYLMHYGRKNQKWGIRNFQNYDGTWTELGKARRRAMSGAGEAARQVKKALKKTGKVTAATIKRTRKAISDASERSREKRVIKEAKRKVVLQKRIEKAMRNNDVAAILKYAPNMTNEQLTSAKTRAELISALSKAAPEKKKSFAQKVATDIGKYAVDKGVGLAKKAASNAGNAAKSKTKSMVDDLLGKAAETTESAASNKPSNTWGYDELKKRQEGSHTSKKQRKKESRRQNDTENWLRAIAYDGPIFRDADGAHSSTKWAQDNLSRVADQYLYEREKKKRHNNYVWHGMRSRRKRRRRR